VTTTRRDRTAWSLGPLAAALLAALLFIAMSGNASADGATLTFSPTSATPGSPLTVHYGGAAIGATIDLVYEETTAGVRHRVTTRLGRTTAKSGTIDMAAPFAVHAYRVEMREDCSGTPHIGDCGLLASAVVPLVPVELTIDPAFPGETVTIHWRNAPAHAALFWSYRIFSTYLIRSAGWIDATSGTLTLPAPEAGWVGTPPTLGMYRTCTERWIGPLPYHSCEDEMASAFLAAPTPEISVAPIGYPGEGAWVTYTNAPSNVELRVIGAARPWGRRETVSVGFIHGPGSEIDPRARLSGTIGFWVPYLYSAERIELRNPCGGACELFPMMLHVYASAPFSIHPGELLVTPSEAHRGDTVTITYTHAPADAAIVRGLTPLGFGSPFATGPSGRRITIARDEGSGDYALTLHARCSFSTVWGYEMADCSPTVASARLRILDDEPVGRPSPSPTATLALAGRATFAAPTPAPSGPSVFGASTDAPGIAGASATPSGDPLASPRPTETPAPSIAGTVRPAATTAPTFAPSPPTLSVPPARTTAPTFAPTPTQTATSLPIVVPTPTATVQPSPTQPPAPSATQKPNTAPQIAKIADQTGKPGQVFTIGVSASDADGDKLTLGCGGADKFVDNGNGTGTFQWTGTKAGKYSFTCTASDGKATASTTFTITLD
jgi:hypothetical protein